MEPNKNLPASTNNQSMDVIVPEQLSKILFDINLLKEFPLADIQIEDWGIKLKKLAPELKSFDLVAILDKFAMSKYKWKDKQGIQNIFEAIELHKQDVIDAWDAKFLSDCRGCENTHENIEKYYDQFKQDQDFLNYLVIKKRINSRYGNQ